MIKHVMLTVAVLTVLAAEPDAARAVDYDKVERSILKQPAYETKQPRYGLLLFGPEAKLRIWFVLDGKTVYLDRNGDGNLTGKDERFKDASACRNITLTDPDGKTRYVITGLSTYEEKADKKIVHQLMVNVDVQGPVSYRQYSDTALGTDHRKSMIAHFHGPLTAGPRTLLWKLPETVRLHTGEKPVELYGVIGTMDARHGCWVVVRTHEGEEKSTFPKGVHPSVEVEFPPRKPGDNPIRTHFTLSGFC